MSTIWNVKVPIIALVEADDPVEAIGKVAHYLRNLSKLHVETLDGDAFESEPLDSTDGVIS